MFCRWLIYKIVDIVRYRAVQHKAVIASGIITNVFIIVSVFCLDRDALLDLLSKPDVLLLTVKWRLETRRGPRCKVISGLPTRGPGH